MLAYKLVVSMTAISLLVGCFATKSIQPKEPLLISTASPAYQDRINHLFYFDFDSALVRQEYSQDIKAHAVYILTSGNRAVVQGMTDTSGLADYNFELGLARARAIQVALVELGVEPEQIIISSIGAAGIGQDARKAVIVY